MEHRSRRKRKTPLIRKILIGILVVVLLVAGIAAGIFAYGYRALDSAQKIPEIDQNTFTNPNISIDQEEVQKGYWNIALFGVDSRDGNLGKGALSDVEMICRINRETGEIRLVSVYRDTYLKVSQKNHYAKINEAYALGGPSQAIEALQENLDLQFDDYATFNWKAVVDAINILGGVDVEITRSEFRLINGFITETVKSTGVGSHHLKSAGMNHLDGVQAVAYARLRKIDTDFKRTERQRLIIQLAMEKAKKADLATLNTLIMTVMPQTTTSIGVDDLLPMAKNLTRYHMGETAGFPFKHSGAVINGGDCVIAEDLESNVVQLHKLLFEDESYTPSKKVREISAQVKKRKANAAAANRTSAVTDDETDQEFETSESETVDKITESSFEGIDEETTVTPTGEGGGPGVLDPKPTYSPEESDEETKPTQSEPHTTAGSDGPGSQETIPPLEEVVPTHPAPTENIHQGPGGNMY